MFFLKRSIVVDIATLLEDDIFTDVIFKVQDKEYKAHKAILSARSAIFKAMFNGKFTEAKSPIELRDQSPQTFKQLLTYLYTGILPEIIDNPDELYITADKFCLSRLKSYCENILIIRLNTENALRFLILADTYNAGNLKTASMCFINTHAPVFMASDEFQTAHRNRAVAAHAQ